MSLFNILFKYKPAQIYPGQIYPGQIYPGQIYPVAHIYPGTPVNTDLELDLDTDSESDSDTDSESKIDNTDLLHPDLSHLDLDPNLDPDLEPGDYYLKKIEHNMEVIDDDIDINNIVINNVNYLASYVLNKYLYNKENENDYDLQIV